jgi:hypothetical protein
MVAGELAGETVFLAEDRAHRARGERRVACKDGGRRPPIDVGARRVALDLLVERLELGVATVAFAAGVVPVDDPARELRELIEHVRILLGSRGVRGPVLLEYVAMPFLEHPGAHERAEHRRGVGRGGEGDSGGRLLKLVELQDPVERYAVVGLVVLVHERPDARVKGFVVVEVLGVVVVGHVRGRHMVWLEVWPERRTRIFSPAPPLG